MNSLTQQPDPAKFNFTKVDEFKELVFVLKNLDEKEQDLLRNVLLINVSPIDEGHCLLVPNVEYLLPQQVRQRKLLQKSFRTLAEIILNFPRNHSELCQVTEAAALAALHLLCLSNSPDIRIGFNSLCAHASVNHMHWHVYYQTHRWVYH